MIVFETQEDFEKAVIEVMKNYLAINVENKGDYYGGSYNKISLLVDNDVVSYETF